MFKIGDKVQFIDGRLNRLFPKHYPSAFSNGKIIDIDEAVEGDMKYQVQWDNGKTLPWYYTDKEIRKIW